MFIIADNPDVVIDFPGTAVKRKSSVRDDPFDSLSHEKFLPRFLEFYNGAQHAPGPHGFKGIIDVFQFNTLGDKTV